MTDPLTESEPTPELTPEQYALLDALRDVAVSPDATTADLAAKELVRLAAEAFGYPLPVPVPRMGGVAGFLYGNPVVPNPPAGAASGGIAAHMARQFAARHDAERVLKQHDEDWRVSLDLERTFVGCICRGHRPDPAAAADARTQHRAHQAAELAKAGLLKVRVSGGIVKRLSIVGERPAGVVVGATNYAARIVISRAEAAELGLTPPDAAPVSATEPWPFKPGTLVRDEDGAEAEWLDVAPVGVVVVSAAVGTVDRDLWARTAGDHWLCLDGGSSWITSPGLAARGPVRVVSVPEPLEACTDDAPAGDA